MRRVTNQQDIDEIGLPVNLEPIRLLGHGSMASVYLARDRNLKRMVAVKVLRSELCDIEQSRQRFEREAQAAARLSHDAVTTVYSTGRLGDDRPYIEMEYIDGANLEELLHSRGPFDVSDACQLLAQVASGLAAAHAQNIVHRDVKPANILVDNTHSKATLTDLGIAAILQTGDSALTRLTRHDERLGDPRYMSPEQLRGEPLTGQSDIYSLGIVAYELLTGHGPFDDAEIKDMASAHIRKPPPELSALAPRVPQWLSDLVKQCLAKKPEHRPRANDLQKRLLYPDDTESSQMLSAPGKQELSFFQELKQRRVYQAAAAYAAITFVLLQVIDLLLQPWPQFSAVFQVAVVATIAGFPITIVLAWIYDWRKGKLVKTDEDSDMAGEESVRLRRKTLVIRGLAVSIVIAVAATWILLGF